MQAIILAAGMGRRLGEFTADNTKCMLAVNGTRLIDRMLRQLSELDLTRIVVVTGYRGDNLRRHISEAFPELRIAYVDNPVYDKTNNIYSLWLAREYMAEEDTLLLESDLIFDDAVLQTAVDSPWPVCALIAKYETWMDGTMVRIDDDNNIISFVPKKGFRYSDTDSYYKTVNIYRFSREFTVSHYLPFLEAYIKAIGENEYYEQVLRVLTLTDTAGIKAIPINGLHWYEIDDVQDLRIAETIFAAPEERLKKLQSAYGGYWRYPALTDFCYLVNPFFPRRRMIDEMKANFEALLRDYPSGMGINSLLAAKNFSLRREYVAVGNGAAELIKSLMENIKGRMGVALPTFEEYPNRLDPSRVVEYHPGAPDFAYTASDIIAFFTLNPVENILIVNPDNPSGNFIPRHDLERLAAWAGEQGVRLIVDESFVDFAEEGEAHTLLHDDILRRFPSLVVMKSISKSYGVPGLRLGILASADTALTELIRRDVGIWNINSFAEFYMQIYSKYERDYAHACELFRAERRIFHAELDGIAGLRVIPSQANYFLCEITSGVTAHELALRLLTRYNILIKDCTTKRGFEGGGQWVRIAIRSREDNARLAAALAETILP